jgi:hypothetical protein
MSMYCINGDGRLKEGRTDKCASCNRLERKAANVKPSDNHTAIEKRSSKGKEVDKKYVARLRTWKRGKKCVANFAHDCSDHITCHHQHGRSDDVFHDEWAEQNGIVLTLDERFWLPLCLDAHRYITDNPKFAHEHGYSYLRLAETVNTKWKK